MLNKETKQKVDDLRQILVGKVADPRSQVEHITNALLYKFMNDMDEESLSLGGVPSYFVNEYEKYSWKILIDKKTSGEERVKIYAEALEKMYFNENLPLTFREIFKNSTLPFKEAKIFNKFITGVNDFKYSNSESLGDAFEYLLSFMGKQGEAGQFRTPRHIINFLVELINPSKNDRILDPASGPAGFLISAHKYILDNNKKKIPGDLLNSDDRKNIANNLNGYDISPEFLKVSLMNMFLHKFNNPNIFEYDTLSDESKWNEYFDIILANPPFFSPKGGITPHNRFSIKSKRAEVLFIDYINEHLKPNGRAGIIVPEGVIFRDDAGYKSLRMKLIKNSLIGIISLPAGIFEPYSGVKTSILILDKKQNKITNYLYYGNINNDGFSLTTNRNPINKNDIPDIKSRIKELDFSDESKLKKIKKEKIINGNIREHIANNTKKESIFDLKFLREIAEVKTGNSAPQDKNLYSNGDSPFIRTYDVGLIKNGTIYESRDYLNSKGIKKLKKFTRGSILLPKSGASTLLNHRVMMGIDSFVSSHLAVIKANNEKILDKYLFYLLKRIDARDLVANPSYPSLNLNEIEKIEIPVPDLNTQIQIVEELDGYQKIIDGCKQVIENYKPLIEFDSNWKKIELNNICEKITDGSHFSPSTISNGLPYVTVKDLTASKIDLLNCKKISKNDFDLLTKNGCKPKKDDTLFSKDGTVGKTAFLTKDNNFVVLSSLAIITPDKSKIEPKFLYYLMSSKFFIDEAINNKTGVAIRRIVLKTLKKIKVPLPPKNIQLKIIEKLDNQMITIQNNESLLSTYEGKIEEKINSIYLT